MKRAQVVEPRRGLQWSAAVIAMEHSGRRRGCNGVPSGAAGACPQCCHGSCCVEAFLSPSALPFFEQHLDGFWCCDAAVAGSSGWFVVTENRHPGDGRCYRGCCSDE
ncbi:hypothetical protein VPH35_130819 [Triticum aestivum]